MELPDGPRDVVEVATRLKAETDDLIVVAGATLAAPLVRAGLVDEFHVVVTPAAVGGGTPFFPKLDKWITLELVENRTFPSGAVLVCTTDTSSPSGSEYPKSAP